MSSGSCESFATLPPVARAVLDDARRAALATVDAHGRPHVVPVCFAIRGDELISAIDHKPKSGVVMARVRNLESNPNAAVMIDRWDEDWSRIAWVMVRGTARLEPPDGAEVLNARYPQYEAMPDHDALIVVAPQRILWWTYAP
jgi:PPOX class probable F420-dependent enzyme